MAGKGSPPGPGFVGLGEGSLTLSTGYPSHSLLYRTEATCLQNLVLRSGAAHRWLAKEQCREAGVPEQFYILQRHVGAPGTLAVLLGVDEVAPTAQPSQSQGQPLWVSGPRRRSGC